MKFKFFEETIYEVQDWERKVLEHDLMSEGLEEDMKRRVGYIISHKIEQCYKRFKEEWEEKLKADPAVKSIPLHPKDFVLMVTARSDYKNRSQKEKEKSKAE